MKVLIAEDETTDAYLLIRILESSGHEPFWVKNGQEALEQMRKNPYPVVISDWMMSGMDGISLCRSIRELRTPFYVYFILLTAKIPQSEGQHVLASGEDAFLAKPVHRQTLQAKLSVARSVAEGADGSSMT